MHSISPNLNLMIKACEKASKVIIRDFGELENLQVSRKGPKDFVTKTDKRVEKILIEELDKSKKNYSDIILFDFYRVLETEIVRSYLLNNLSELYKSSIHCYTSSRFNLLNFTWLRFYKSFGTKKFIFVNLTKNQKKESLNLFNETIIKIKMIKHLEHFKN